MIEELTQLGLTKNESITYSILLKYSSITAGEIIKESKLHRNIVYENLDRLIEKGLVNFILIKGIKHFQTSNVSELKRYIDEEKKKVSKKEEILTKIIPRIEKLKVKKPLREASIIYGKKALKEILEEITLSKTDLLVFGTGWGMKSTFENYYEQWHLKLKKNKIKCKIILPLSNNGNFLIPFDAKYLDNKNLIPSTIAIYEDKILNITWGEEPLSFLIINKQLSDSYREYFKCLWEVATK